MHVLVSGLPPFNSSICHEQRIYISRMYLENERACSKAVTEVSLFPVSPRVMVHIPSKQISVFESACFVQ